MKKKSILFTCIVAIMALAMFVGCDNAPTLPSFVVGGTINQTGDFLEGQAFDPSKFTVTITYDNGRIVAADETVSVYLDTDKGAVGKVNVGDTVKADLGKNFADSDICATAAVKVYNIKSIAVTGPESYPGHAEAVSANVTIDIPESDLTVTATYLDSENAEKTMVLVPGEYLVDPATVKNLTEENPSVEAKATVKALVGNFNGVAVNADFNFTATWNGESTKLPEDAVVSKIEVEFVSETTEYSLAKLDYGTELPAVDASKFKVTAFVGEEEYSVDSSDVTFTWVDKDGYAFTSNNLYTDKASGVGILAEFAGVSTVFVNEKLTLDDANITVVKSGTYKDPILVAGSDLPDMSSMLKAYIDKDRIAPEDEGLEWVYAYKENNFGSVSGSTPITDGKIPAADTYTTTTGGDSDTVKVGSTYLVVYPVYKGVSATQGIALGKIEPVETTYVIESADLSGITLAAQQYTTAPEYTTGVKSVLIRPSEGAVMAPNGNFDKFGITFAYSLTDDVMTPLTDGVDLRDVDQIYVKVTYAYAVGKASVAYFPLTLAPAYADSLDVDVEYSAATKDGKPLADATATVKVNAVNDLGIVAELEEGEYNIVNRTTGMIDEITVAATEQTYGFNAIVDGENGPKKIRLTPDLTIPAWTPYYELTGEELVITPAEGVEETIYYYNDSLKDTALDTADYTVSGYKAHGTDTPITISGFELVTTNVAVGENTVYAKVSYVGETGETVNDLVPFTVIGYDYPETVTATLKDDLVVYTGTPYTLDMFNFDVEWASGTEYADNEAPEIEFTLKEPVTATNTDGENVVFAWSCNGKTQDRFIAWVKPVEDYPVSITVASDTITGQPSTTYDDDDFGFQVTWFSGRTFGEGATPIDQMPTIEYKYTCPAANVTDGESVTTWSTPEKEYAVEISWTCNGHSSEAPIEVTIDVG